VTQAPLPLQLEAAVNVVDAAGQVDPAQDVPFAYSWQTPAWQRPFVPHVVAPMSRHSPAGSVAPVATFVHVPSMPGSAHDWQAPAQALSQHTPCAQKLEPHSLACEHEAPLFFGPHELTLQTFGMRQFVSVVQAPKHDVPLQTYGLHGSESGATHWPVALQLAGGLYTFDVHDSGAHSVPTLYFWQAPAPSHLPFVEHAAAVRSVQSARGSTLPAGIDVHLPGAEAREQLRHAPVQVVSQQMLSTQWEDWHSASSEHGCPLPLGPHRPLTHTWPVSQSLFVTQILLHASVTQRNGLQFCTPCGWHVPVPSHVPGVLRREPVHDGGRHCVSAAYFAQPPNPSHVPVVPQLGAPWSLQTARRSAWPASVGQQVPRRPGSAHDTQPPAQATLQQMLSAQKPDAQSPFTLHVAPFIFLPQLEPTHCWPATHWLDCVHVSKQALVVVSHV